VTPSLGDIVGDFADAFKTVDETRPQGASRTRTHKLGIGPLTEADAVNRALQYLEDRVPSSYVEALSVLR